MPCITKSDLSKPLDLKTKRFPMPDWGKDSYVNVRALGSKQSCEIERYVADKPTDEISLTFAYMQLVYCLVDDQGNQIYEDAKDVEANLDISLVTLVALAEFCTGLTERDSKKSTRKKKS